MKVVSLFSGIGGFELGLGAAGHETILTCENWAPAQAVLRRWLGEGGVPNEPDIRVLRSLPADAELLCAGFPCQDLSQAGKTVGIEGERSGLVREVFRLLDDHPVPWLVLENVSFMLSLRKGEAMTLLVSALEERGYRWAYRVVNSLGWLPHRRERVFLVASREGDPRDVLFDDDATPRLLPTDLDLYPHGFYWTEGIRGLGWAPDHVPTLKNGSTVGIPSPPAILMPDGSIGTPDIRDAEKLQGFGPGHTAPAGEVGRASWRWSLVGNAVTVPVARWLGTRLVEPANYHADRNKPFALVDGKWPAAAFFDGSKRRGVEIGRYPRFMGRPSLAAFLDHPLKPLSVRATAGFHARIETSSLSLVTAEFKRRVRAHHDHMLRQDRSPERLAA